MVTAFCALFFIASAHAQQFDVAFGVGTVSGQQASDGFNNPDHTPQSIGGGGYPAFSGDFLFKKNFGVGGQVAWRGHQNFDIFGQPYRPILYDFNAIYAPMLGKRVQAEGQGGIGWESIRFYTPFLNCSGFTGTCTDFTSSNHFLIHVGGGLRFFLHGGLFVRPEGHLYFIHNNVEFSGPRVARYGVSIGYAFRSKD